MSALPADLPVVAVVEDDEDIRANVCRFLERSGLRAWGVGSAEDFYVSLLRERADLVVADLGLPGESGQVLVQRLARQGIPVVVLTGQGDLDSRIAGLEAGALQYFVKPADLRELAAGIHSQLRHLGRRAAQEPQEPQWRLDGCATRLVAPNQRSVALTTREQELLSVLVLAQGSLVSKQTLVDATGGGSAAEDSYHRIEAQLTRLRRKTLEATGIALPVRAVFGKGLVFVP